MCSLYIRSAAQGGGRSLQNKKEPLGEAGSLGCIDANVLRATAACNSGYALWRQISFELSRSTKLLKHTALRTFLSVIHAHPS